MSWLRPVRPARLRWEGAPLVRCPPSRALEAVAGPVGACGGHFMREKMNRQSKARQDAIARAAAACGQSVEDFTEALIDRGLVCICVPKSPETTRAYATDYALFAEWCAARGLESLPAIPATVHAYFADTRSSLSDSTARRRIAGIRFEHVLAGLQPPLDDAIRTAMLGIRRARRPRKKND